MCLAAPQGVHSRHVLSFSENLLHVTVAGAFWPVVQNSVALVTGTLGLSFPQTAAAMRKAVAVARSGPCSVLVDINWRPVFWESLTPQAVDIVSEYAGGADILKLSEEEAEWLYGVHSDQAMSQPDLVCLAVLAPCSLCLSC